MRVEDVRAPEQVRDQRGQALRLELIDKPLTGDVHLRAHDHRQLEPLRQLEQLDDFPGEMLLLEQMKQIGSDIIARMLHDYMKCESLVLKAIPGFNINSVSYEMLGPVFDNDYGVMFSFKLQDCLDFGNDFTKWN